jgi:hypothetical protein
MVIFTYRPLYPLRKAPGTQWIRCRVSPRAGLDAVTKSKIPGPATNRTMVVQPVTTLTELSWLLDEVNTKFYLVLQ